MTPGILACLLCWSMLPLAAAFQRKTSKPPSLGSPRPRESWEKAEKSLLEVGRAQKLRQAQLVAGQIKAISYNIRWRSGAELDKLIELFRNDLEIGNAAIMGLQEVDRKKKRSGNTNTVKLIADELGLYYAWAAPPAPHADDEEETGVGILSLFPMSDIQRIVLPHEGPGHRRRVALGATLKIDETSVRVYSVHSETRIPLGQKIEQMSAVLEDLSHYPKLMPALVVGDFNTWEANAATKTSKLFTGSGFQTPFGAETTFFRRILFVPLELKLDWVWLRGLEFTAYGIDRKVEISDHWPLWINLKLPAEKK